MEKVNQEIIDQAESIARSQGYRLSDRDRDAAEHWRVQRVKRIIFSCVKLNDNTSGPEKVLLKYRPANSTITKERFIANENSSQALNQQLEQAGIKAQRTLKTQFAETPEWIFREYLPGEPLGNHSIPENVDEEALFTYLLQLREKLKKLVPTINRDLLNNYNWNEKLNNEYFERRHFLEEHLDHKTLTQFDLAHRQEIKASNETVLHGDLAPTNILTHDKQFLAIDWGEASIGPAVVDWMIVWSTAVYQPQLRENILKEVMKEPVNNQLDSTSIFAIKVASRMLSTFAEGLNYYLTHPEEDEIFRQEITRMFPLAVQNTKELLEKIGQNK